MNFLANEVSKSGLIVAVLYIFTVGFLDGDYAIAQNTSTFEGIKSSWYGFDRYDFEMDEQTLALTPVQLTSEEGMGVRAPENGKRRCVVIVPKTIAAGKPWSWRGVIGTMNRKQK